MVTLSFYPTAFTEKRFGNGTSICPLPGEKVDGRVVDTDCDVDKFELCMTNLYGCGSGAHHGECPSRTQADIVEFLACFEGKHHADFKYAKTCASKTKSLEYSKIEACYKDTKLVNELWKKQMAMPQRKKLDAFPTVTVDGEMWNGTIALSKMISTAYKRKN